jgi:phosphoglycolate phosphatase
MRQARCDPMQRDTGAARAAGVNEPAAVLVDLDGTLVDTAPDMAEAVNRMRADAGLPPLAEARVSAFVGKGAEVLVHRGLTDALEGRVDAGALARGMASFFRHYHEVNGLRSAVFDDAHQAMALLREAGLRLACVTNKPREFTLPLLARTGLSGFFEAVVAGDDVPQRKPHPAMLLAACARLGVSAGQAVMLGDSLNDAQAARAAGCAAVLVRTGYNEGQPLPSASGEGAVEIAMDGWPQAAAIVPRLLDAARWILRPRAAGG